MDTDKGISSQISPLDRMGQGIWRLGDSETGNLTVASVSL